MSRQVFVINVVGLTEDLIGDHSPFFQSLARENSVHFIEAVVPAVTCSAQSTYLTGELPCVHGAVANGWYFKDLAEVMFWKQSNHLISGEWVWEALRKKWPKARTSQMFWWYNMHSSADYSVTPRPMYPADGRKIPDCYAHPLSLREELTEALGPFPLFQFWGPMTSIASSRWIAEATAYVNQKHRPELNLVYLPHLDYNLQRLGPKHPDIKKDVAEIDKVVCDLWTQVQGDGVDLLILSEYGITEVDNPISLNRHFRKKGWLQIKTELGLELLDVGQCRVFAVADHQAAHVYCNDQSLIGQVRDLVESLEGVESVWDRSEQKRRGLDHERSGDLFLLSDARSWFTYYYWLDDDLAPDFARTVDIHRKPGYDPVELFIDPEMSFAKLQIAFKLLKKTLGFRQLMDVIPLDARLVKGSHGRPTDRRQEGPILLGTRKDLLAAKEVYSPTEIKPLILDHF